MTGDWATGSDLFAASIVPSRAAVESRVATLCWQDEAGGFSFSREDVLAMDLDEMDRYIRIMNARRKARNDAIRESQRKTKVPKR